MGELVMEKDDNNSVFTKIKIVFHFLSTVLMYSVCLIMIIIFLIFVVNFIDKQQNLKAGNAKRDLLSAYTIVSPSMVPTINVLDVVVIKRVDNPTDLKKGDIVTFTSTDYRYSGITITHRIVNVEKTSSGKYLYTTKGDNNNTQDSARISFDEIYGKLLFRIPKIGYLQYWLSSILGWVAIIIVPAVCIIGYDIFKLIKTIRSKNNGINDNNLEKDKKKKNRKERFKK